MKKILFILSFATLTTAFGQRPDVLIGNDYESISGFGGVFITLASLDGQVMPYTGGGGAVLLDNTFYFGGYGLGLSGDQTITARSNSNEYDVDISHGGFMLGYNIKPSKLAHIGISSKLGWGSIDYRARDDANSNVDDQIFVIFPQAEVEFNMTHWFKLNVGVGYQQVIGVDDFHYKQSEVSSPAASISFLFGWFY
ncbi:MAG: hypothetical protein R8G66_31340 [Cytophagales bacterium]|nr:hypothetical protein [Cytophagales bacterium]